LITLSGSISGNSVSQVGSGDLVLTASNTYTGLTLVTNGTLHVRNAWALGSPAGGTVVSNTGSLFIDQNVDLTNEPLSLGGSGLSSSGALHKGGAGATMIGGLVTLSASTTINIDGGSTLNLSNGNGITGNNVSLTLNVVGSGTNAGPISLGTGSLIVSGSGSWTLPATDTYTGLTTLNGGTLFIPALSALGPVSVATPNYITFSGGTLGALSSLNFTDSFHGMTVVAGSNAGFNIATNMTVTISNNITGSGTIVKSGPGTLLLDGSNSFSGVLSLDRGIDGNNNDGLTIITRTDAVANVTTIQTLNTTVSTAGGAILELAPTSAGMTFPQEFILGCRDNMTTPTILNNNGTNTIAGFTALQIGGNIVNYSASAGSELIISGNVQFIGTLTALRDLYFSVRARCW
jgi:autotransporter-associated beta strand protein